MLFVVRITIVVPAGIVAAEADAWIPARSATAAIVIHTFNVFILLGVSHLYFPGSEDQLSEKLSGLFCALVERAFRATAEAAVCNSRRDDFVGSTWPATPHAR